nr:SafA/ExsA family spore coat assembly protein [Litchfieldia alkalitelluris]
MKIHIVQKGETLWKISQKYGVDFEELKKLNSQLSNPDMIMPGMKIKIPSGNVHVKKEQVANTSPVQKEAQVPKEQQVQKEQVKKEQVKAEHPYKDISPAPSPVLGVEEALPKKEAVKPTPKAPYVPKMPTSIDVDVDLNNQMNVNMPISKTNVFPGMMKPEWDEVESVKEELPPKMPKMPEMPNLPNVPAGYTPPPQVAGVTDTPYCEPMTPVMPGAGFDFPGVPPMPGGAPVGPVPGGYPQVAPTQGFQPNVPTDFDEDDDLDLPPAPPWNTGVPGAAAGTPYPGAPGAAAGTPYPGAPGAAAGTPYAGAPGAAAGTPYPGAPGAAAGTPYPGAPGATGTPYPGAPGVAPAGTPYMGAPDFAPTGAPYMGTPGVAPVGTPYMGTPGAAPFNPAPYGGYATPPGYGFQGPVGPMRNEYPVLPGMYEEDFEDDVDADDTPGAYNGPGTVAPAGYQGYPQPQMPPMGYQGYPQPQMPPTAYQQQPFPPHGKDCGCGGPTPMPPQGYPGGPGYGGAPSPGYGVPAPGGYPTAPGYPAPAPGYGVAPGFAPGTPTYGMGMNPYDPTRSMPYNPMFELPDFDDEESDD